MDFYDLDLDEAIIIQSSNVSRNGYDESEFEDEYLQEILLTNKKIVYVVAEDDGTDGEDCDVITVPLSAVKVINGQVQVKQFQHDLYGLCMQIQFAHGVEYWQFGVKAKQQIPRWVIEISKAVLATPRIAEKNQQKRQPQAQHNVEQSEVTAAAANNSSGTCFCVNCGAKMLRTAKFCSECGAKAGKTIVQVSQQGPVVYDGKIHKCRQCGEVLKSFETVCPVCGYELRDAYASIAIRSFAEKMEQLQQNGKSKDKNNIINLIRTFPIPNTKEDLFEFIILAGSNIRNDRYGDLPKYKQEISDAWSAKFEQAYNKARVAFGDDPDFSQVKEIYSVKAKEIRSNKVAGFFSKEGTKTWILLIVMYAIFGVVVAGIFSADRIRINAENKRLDAIVEEVYTCLEEEQYALARAKASALVFSGSTTEAGDQAAAKWDITRNQLLGMIDKAEYGDNYVSPPREIRIGSAHDDFVDDDYQDVRKRLNDLGFTNVKTQPVKDWTAGWWTEEGSVQKITIAGDTVFSEDSTFMSDVEIIIYYSAAKDQLFYESIIRRCIYGILYQLWK